MKPCLKQPEISGKCVLHSKYSLSCSVTVESSFAVAGFEAQLTNCYWANQHHSRSIPDGTQAWLRGEARILPLLLPKLCKKIPNKHWTFFSHATFHSCRHLQIDLFGHSWEVPSLHFSKPVLQENPSCSSLPVLQISLTALSGDLLFVVLCLALESTKLLLIYAVTWRQWLQLKKKQPPCHCRDITSIQQGWFRLGIQKNASVILWVVIL